MRGQRARTITTSWCSTASCDAITCCCCYNDWGQVTQWYQGHECDSSNSSTDVRLAAAAEAVRSAVAVHSIARGADKALEQ
jgi:hypothetical protein